MEELQEKVMLEDMISKITSKYDVEQIYLNAYYKKWEDYELIVLVSDKYMENLGDVVPKIVNSIKENPLFRGSCYVASEAKDKIKEGNLFLFVSCQREKLVYEKEISEFKLLTDEFDFNKCKELTINLKNLQREKVEEFKEGYYHFKEKEQYSLASFMLHQAMELTYRHLEVLLVGKEQITHSVQAHHKYMKKISSMYDGVFDEEGYEDDTLLHILEDMYGASRYEDDFKVAPEVLDKLELKMESLHVLAGQIFQQMLISIEQLYTKHLKSIDRADYVPLKIANKKLDNHPDLRSAIQDLVEKFKEPVAIYMFGHRIRSFSIDGVNKLGASEVRNHHFDLLVISKTDVRTKLNKLQALINERLGISVFIISYTKAQAQKELDMNSPFFHQVLSDKEKLLHAGIDVGNWFFHEKNGKRTNEKIEWSRQEWIIRIFNAESFERVGRELYDPKDTNAKVVLYNHALEQICFGMLEFFYEYAPYQYDLNHLYSLCSAFWSFPNELFPRASEEEKKEFDKFFDLLEFFRYKWEPRFDTSEADRYEELCRQFDVRSTELVRASFLSD